MGVNMKPNLLLLVIVFLLLISINYTGFSEEVTVISIDDYSGISGEEVSIDIRLSANSNVCVGTFYITYDKTILELIS